MEIVFSDLDGTLLDHFTYSYEEAIPGIEILRQRSIPLVLVSSKTEPEMKILHRELNLDSPFIFENGAGIAYPRNGGSFKIELLGLDTGSLFDKFFLIKELLGTPLKAIGEMEADEIMERTGLPKEIAQFAKMRRASLPFIMEKDTETDINYLNRINETLKEHKLIVTKGGRFFHFSSIDANKGSAVKKIIDFYTCPEQSESIKTAAMGDSENDIPMFNSVDIPVLIRRYDNSIIKTGIDDIRITEKSGPAGFTEAVKEIFL